jgi:DNA-binding MarR family transcriptional regulator
MVLNLEQFNLEDLAAKNTTKILRHMIMHPYLAWGLSELSSEINVSKSNVFRILKILLENNLIIEYKSGRKKLFRINIELDLIQELWKLYMIEKKYNLPSQFKNAIDLVYNQFKDEIDVFIVFGSLSQGLSTEKIDMGICIVSPVDLNINRFDFLPYRLEIHQYTWNDLENFTDFVVLDAMINGIVYKGDIFNLISNMRSFSKDYLLYQLEKAKEFNLKSKSYNSEVNEYFKQLAEISINELKSIIGKGTTTPKKLIEIEDIDLEVEDLENNLSKEGDKIWLI